MFKVNDSEYKNSITFFGPLNMAFYEDGNVLDDTLTVKISLSISLMLIMTLGLIGNLCTCAMIARKRSMWTPSNCYLFNLAITDLLMLLFTPLEIYIIWYPDMYPLGEIGCRMHFILWDCASNSSLLIITTFTVERYLVVKKPFLRQKLAEISRVFKIVAAIWFISILFALPDWLYIDLLERKKYVFCYVTMSRIVSMFVMVETFVFFIIPLTIICVLYGLMTFELKCRKKKMAHSPVNEHNNDKAAIMLVTFTWTRHSDYNITDAAIASTFFLSWSPYCLIRIMIISTTYTHEEYYNVWKTLNYLCYCSYVSSAINPILYSLMSRKFRKEFKGFFSRRKSSNPTGMATVTNSSNGVILREIK